MNSSIGAELLIGPPVAPSFSLTDHHGRPVTEADYRGRFLLVYFGFTHCRVVCPRTLTRLSGVLDDLGTAARMIQPLYITVDPERDTPEVMRAFLEDRFPAFLGLTGSLERVAAAKMEFRVFAERRSDPLDGDGYAVPHSATTFLVGPDGAFRAYFPETLDREAVGQRLRAQIESAGVVP